MDDVVNKEHPIPGIETIGEAASRDIDDIIKEDRHNGSR
jgi:hypothetical protein